VCFTARGGRSVFGCPTASHVREHGVRLAEVARWLAVAVIVAVVVVAVKVAVGLLILG